MSKYIYNTTTCLHFILLTNIQLPITVAIKLKKQDDRTTKIEQKDIENFSFKWTNIILLLPKEKT